MFYFLTMYHSIFFNYIIIFFTYICIYYANAIITKFYISYYDKIIYGFDPNIMKYKTITFSNIFIRHHHINKKVLYTDIFIFVTYNTFLICILLKILCSDCNANFFFALTHSAMHR